MNRMFRPLALGACILAAVLAPSLAGALSCVPWPPLDEAIARAKVAFVGTVVGTVDAYTPGSSTVGGPSQSAVRVEEVLKGGPLPPQVVVSSFATEGPLPAGVRYVFVPGNDTEPYEITCTATTPLDRPDPVPPAGGPPVPDPAPAPPGEPRTMPLEEPDWAAPDPGRPRVPDPLAPPAVSDPARPPVPAPAVDDLVVTTAFGAEGPAAGAEPDGTEGAGWLRAAAVALGALGAGLVILRRRRGARV